MEILIHLPHVSTRLPKLFYQDLLVTKEEAMRFNLKMSDLHVDKLFEQVEGTRFYASYSRLFCDMEKFRDDKAEFMAKFGQGVVYTHAYDGTLLRNPSEAYRAKVLQYYDRYHRTLDETAIGLLHKKGELLILDCHSFSDEQAVRFAKPPFPDVCIGIEPHFYEEEIFQKIVAEVKKRGLSYAVNYPYRGSLVPNCFFNGSYTGKVVSIMLEINKRIYL